MVGMKGTREKPSIVSARTPFTSSHQKSNAITHGREELYKFFGGDNGADIPMKMTWHHLAFSEKEQIGFGEYSFEMHGRYHGIVVMKIEAGPIKHWREYQYSSELNWKEFTRHNPF